MPKQGSDKQVPLEQRGRGLNPEHPEGQANLRNQQQAKPSPAPAPAGGKEGGNG